MRSSTQPDEHGNTDAADEDNAPDEGADIYMMRKCRVEYGAGE